MRNAFSAVPLAALLLLFSVPAAHPFTGEGCAGGACTDCHSLSRDEAVKILGGTVDNVLAEAEGMLSLLDEGADSPHSKK